MMQDNPNEENPESKKKSSTTYLAPRRGGSRASRHTKLQNPQKENQETSR